MGRSNGRPREDSKRRIRELGGKDTVGGSHTNYLRKRFFKYQLGFSSQSLHCAVAFPCEEGLDFVTRQVESSGRSAQVLEDSPRFIIDPFPPAVRIAAANFVESRISLIELRGKEGSDFCPLLFAFLVKGG